MWRACLLGGGDDYELLFTAPPTARDSMIAVSQQLALPLTRIGRMQRAHKAVDTDGIAATVQLLDNAHQPIDLSRVRSGYDHFA
jgi:thiamine-monophosphate kinase